MKICWSLFDSLLSTLDYSPLQQVPAHQNSVIGSQTQLPQYQQQPPSQQFLAQAQSLPTQYSQQHHSLHQQKFPPQQQSFAQDPKSSHKHLSPSTDNETQASGAVYPSEKDCPTAYPCMENDVTSRLAPKYGPFYLIVPPNNLAD